MRFTLKQVLAPLTVVVFFGIIAFYGYYQSRDIIEGPVVHIDIPSPGTTSTTSLIAIKGSVKRAKEITLDGRPIFIDLAGHFTEKLVLSPGYNIIELIATDAQGRVHREKIELVYKKID